MIERKTFLFQYVVRNEQDITRPKLISELPEFPRDVVIHDFAGNYPMTRIPEPYPDMDLWFCKTLPTRKYLYHFRKPAEPSLMPYPEEFVLQNDKFTSRLSKYRMATQSFAKEVLDPIALPRSRPDIQCILNYNPLFFARVFG
ncbi:hypothetical protein EOM86_12480, partial [Candidatus Nomurabacteria bacterium]|nr:hypothetical protein [Candidatus Nomurabacteria bacterium]